MAPGCIVGLLGQWQVVGRNRHRLSTAEIRFMATVEVQREMGLREVQRLRPNEQMKFKGERPSMQMKFTYARPGAQTRFAKVLQRTQDQVRRRHVRAKLSWSVFGLTRHVQMRFKLGRNFQNIPILLENVRHQNEARIEPKEASLENSLRTTNSREL